MFFFSLRRDLFNLFYKMGNFVGLNKNVVSILCYHSFSNNPDRYSINLETFARQMQKIAHYASFVSLDDIVESLKGKKLKTPAIALTIDDGFTDVTKILPVTKKYRIPVTLFVLAETKNADREQLQNKHKLLNSQELKHLISQGWTIGCHSATHTDFYSLNKNGFKREVIDAKRMLEKNLGVQVKYFSYPKGVFDEEVVRAVQQAGYEAAFVVSPNCVNRGSNKWLLPRVVVDKTHAIGEFPALYSETTFFLRRITQPLKLWNIFLQIDKTNEKTA